MPPQENVPLPQNPPESAPNAQPPVPPQAVPPQPQPVVTAATTFEQPAPQAPVQPMQQPVAPPAPETFQQPAPQPQMFAAPPQPQGMVQPMQPGQMPAYGYNSSQSKFAGRLSKAILLRLAVAFGVLLILIGGFIGFTKLGGVSVADYRESVTQFNKVSDSYSKLGSVYLSTTSTDTEIRNGLDTLQQAKTSFDDELKALGNTKAVKKDKDLAKLFKVVTDKKPKFDAFMVTSIESYEKLLPVLSRLGDVLNDSSASTATITNFKNELANLDLKDSTNIKLVSTLTQDLSKYATLLNKIQAARKDYTKYDSNTYSQYYDVARDMSNAVRDWQSNITKRADDAELQEQLNAFGDKLADKAYARKE